MHGIIAARCKYHFYKLLTLYFLFAPSINLKCIEVLRKIFSWMRAAGRRCPRMCTSHTLIKLWMNNNIQFSSSTCIMNYMDMNVLHGHKATHRSGIQSICHSFHSSHHPKSIWWMGSVVVALHTNRQRRPRSLALHKIGVQTLCAHGNCKRCEKIFITQKEAMERSQKIHQKLSAALFFSFWRIENWEKKKAATTLHPYTIMMQCFM